MEIAEGKVSQRMEGKSKKMGERMAVVLETHWKHCAAADKTRCTKGTTDFWDLMGKRKNKGGKMKPPMGNQKNVAQSHEPPHASNRKALGVRTKVVHASCGSHMRKR